MVSPAQPHTPHRLPHGRRHANSNATPARRLAEPIAPHPASPAPAGRLADPASARRLASAALLPGMVRTRRRQALTSYYWYFSLCKPKSHSEVVKRPLAGGLIVINAARRAPAATAEVQELAAASMTPLSTS